MSSRSHELNQDQRIGAIATHCRRHIGRTPPIEQNREKDTRSHFFHTSITSQGGTLGTNGLTHWNLAPYENPSIHVIYIATISVRDGYVQREPRSHRSHLQVTWHHAHHPENTPIHVLTHTIHISNTPSASVDSNPPRRSPTFFHVTKNNIITNQHQENRHQEHI